uniref:Uncharacterized protein n=1 Tax=Panagrolaimus sp. JU765 TaxID=591449 RepID=A0AC34Q201_9BILA
MMICCFVLRLLLTCTLLLVDSFVLPPTGPQKIQAPLDGFSIKMCLEDGQYARFCFRGSPTKKQRNRCNAGFCGVLSSFYSHESKETMVIFGEEVVFTREKCITFRILPSEQKVEIEAAQNERGTCNWQRESNGALEIYAESTLSSPIEVIGAEMFVDKKEEEEKPKTWIAAPIVISVLVVVGLLILGIWCWKCRKDQKKDVDIQKKPDTEKGLTIPRKIEENAEEKKMTYISDSNEPVQVENEEGRSRKASWMKREKKCSRHNEQGRCHAKTKQKETAKKEAKEGERTNEEPAGNAGGKNCRILVNILVKDIINMLIYTTVN